MNHLNRRSFALVSAALLGAISLASQGCQRISAAAEISPEDTHQVATVPTVQPQRRALQKTIELSGYAEGFEMAPIHAKIAGYVEKLHVDINDEVKKGQLLAELSIPETVAELKQKAATVIQSKIEIAQAKQMLQVADASVARAQANVQLADATRNKAESNYVRYRADNERYQRLVTTRAVSVMDADQTNDQFHTAEAARAEATAAVDAAKATVTESKAQREKAAIDVQVAEAKLAVAEADHQRLAALAAYGEIRAPFSGTITKRHLNAGHLLQPTGAQVVNGIALFELVRTDKIRVFIDVPEHDAASVSIGDKATVVVAALQEREFTGEIARTSWALDRQLRTMRVEIDVVNEKGILRPGMYVVGRLKLKRPETYTIPVASVLYQDDVSYVVRVEKGKAVRTPVKLGQRQGATIEVLRKMVQAPAEDGRRPWEEITGNEIILAKDPNAYVDGQELGR